MSKIDEAYRRESQRLKEMPGKKTREESFRLLLIGLAIFSGLFLVGLKYFPKPGMRTEVSATTGK